MNVGSEKIESTVEELRSALKKDAEEKQMSIDNCLRCAEACEALVESSDLSILRDCLDICYLSAKFMARESEFHFKTCELCAEICLKCAAVCETQTSNLQMLECAKRCRECAETCLRMSRSH